MSTLSGLVQIFVLTVLATLSACERSSYGEICSNTQRCDRRAWLGCYAGKCECVKPDEMIFEETTGKCASKAGERCKYALEHSDGNKSYEYASCVENSVCGPDGFCSCDEDYYENANGTCSPKKKYSESCDANAKCSSRLGLVCNTDVCKCSDRTSYLPEENQCVGLAGRACVLSKCTENAECIANKCTCQDGFYQTFDDGCSRRLDLLANCTTDGQCKNEVGLTLKCVDGECKCDPGISLFGTGRKHKSTERQCYSSSTFYSFYPESYTQCLGKVGQYCIEDLCAPGSYCDYNPLCGSGSRMCVCRPGYSESDFGTCGRLYHEECDSPGTCLDGLVCSRLTNTCKCRYAIQKYSASEKKCYSPVGGPCDEYYGCVGRAECVKMSNSKTRGTCQCIEGYVEAAFGTCEVAFGMPCIGGTVCDSLAGLACIEDTCQCEDFKLFDITTKACVGLAGSQCDLNVKGQQCVENSSCLKVRQQHNTGRCTCNPGHIINGNYTCELKFQEDENSRNIPVLTFPVIYDVDVDTSTEED